MNHALPTEQLLTQGPRAWGRMGVLWAFWTLSFVVWGEAKPMQADIYARFQQGFIRTWWDKDLVNVLTATLSFTSLLAVGFAVQAWQQCQFTDEKVPRSYFAMGSASLVAVVALRLWVR